MYISKLNATGVKGRNFNHDLSPLVLFTGKNASGKTARLEAIRFCFLGYLPELGRQNFATWDMVTGSVAIGFSEEKYDNLVRMLLKSGDTIKESVDCPSELKALIDKPMPFLNVEEYFGLSEQERIQYIFRTMKVPDIYTVQGVLADLRNLSLEENTEYTEQARAEVLLAAEKALRENGISGGLDELTRDKGALKTSFTFWNRRIKDSVGAVRMLSELKTAAGDVSAETLEGIKKQIETAEKELATANEEVGKLSQRAMEANRVTNRRRQIEAEFAVPVTNRDAEIKQLEKKIEKIAPDKTATIQKVTGLMNFWQEAEVAAIDARTARDSTLEKISEIDDQLEALKKMTTCPTCKASGANWKAGATREYKKQKKTLETNLEKQEADVITLVGKADRAKKDSVATSAAWTSRQQAEKLISETLSHIQTIKSGVREKEAHRRTISDELANLAASAPPSDKTLSAAAATAQAAKEKKDKLSGRHDNIIRLQQELRRSEEAAAEHLKAAARVTVLKAAMEHLRSKQSDMIDTLFGDLLKHANYFTDGILHGELAFAGGTVGLFRGAQFVSHKLLSGTEKALTYVAISAALSKDWPIKLVMLDELGRLDRYNKIKVFTRLSEAVRDKVIDQVIAIDTAAPEESDGWQVINVSEAA